MPIKNILNEVLSDIKPSKKEVSEVSSIADSFIKSLNQSLKDKKINAKAVFGGSFAKDSWISGDFDIDIFVKFDLNYKNQDLSSLLQKALSKFNFERIHGSRDYFWIKHKNIRFEIVPVLDIKSPENAVNVTDFSPLHVAWVKNNSKNLVDDILLLKQFCKANGVYGAESYINGFSGHVVDNLIIYFKGFLPLLKSASKWNLKKKIVLDFYDKHKGKALFNINKSKTEGPVVLVDPVQPDRNASAALSAEKLRLFINYAKKFLKAPSKSFFKIKKIDLEKLMKKDYFIISAKPKKGKTDVVGCKLLSVFNFLKNSLEEHDFKIKDCDWFWDKSSNALFWFKLDKDSLSEIKEHKGPPTDMISAVKSFKTKYKNTFKKDAHIWAKVKREFKDAKSLLKNSFKANYMKDKVLTINLEK